jgi:hypothetical protein
VHCYGHTRERTMETTFPCVSARNLRSYKNAQCYGEIGMSIEM